MGILLCHGLVKIFQIVHAAFMNQNSFGMTGNVIMTYIWVATAVNVLIAILKKWLSLGMSLYTIREISTLALFKKRPFHRYRHLRTMQN